MRRLTVLDDYQNVALTSADWSAVRDLFEIRVIDRYIAEPSELASLLADSEIIVAMRERTAFPRELLERLPSLRLLVTTGMMNAAIDLDAARDLGVMVAGTGGAGNAVAELTIGMMVALTRNFVREDASVRSGGWQHAIGPGLNGLTLGLYGLGRIGGAVAGIAGALGMRVSAWSPRLTPERAEAAGATAVSRDELFASADILSVHVPLTPETRGAITARELSLMAPDSYLINTSRGPIVDQSALVAALNGGGIAGAALDVYDQEPLPEGSPLLSAPNTLLLPHIGYVITQAYERFYGDAVEDILAFEAGAPVRRLA